MNTNRNQVIATEIKQQLGWQCLFLLGAKNFIGDEVEKDGRRRPYLGFKIKGSPAANYIRVILDEGSDTYMVDFLKITATKIETVAEYTEIHCGDLHKLISEQTGLATKF